MTPPRPGNRIREWRKARGLTQEQLGEMVGTTKAVISHLELGSRGLYSEWLTKIADALSVPPAALLPMLGSPSDDHGHRAYLMERTLREILRLTDQESSSQAMGHVRVLALAALRADDGHVS